MSYWYQISGWANLDVTMQDCMDCYLGGELNNFPPLFPYEHVLRQTDSQHSIGIYWSWTDWKLTPVRCMFVAWFMVYTRVSPGKKVPDSILSSYTRQNNNKGLNKYRYYWYVVIKLMSHGFIWYPQISNIVMKTLQKMKLSKKIPLTELRL